MYDNDRFVRLLLGLEGLMHRVVLSIAASVCALAVVGCYSGEGSGELAFETYPVADFDVVALAGEGSVTITPGEFAVSASAEDNVLPSLRVLREGSALMLRRDVDVIDGIRAELPIEYHVSMPRLAEARVSGSGAMAIRGFESQAPLRLEAKGASGVDAAGVAASAVTVAASGAAAVTFVGLAVRGLDCEISGSAHVSAAGEAETLALNIRGSAVFRGARLRVAAAKAQVAGAAQGFVWASETLDAEVGGRGRLLYRGAPALTRTLQREGQLIALASSSDLRDG